jgi:hypothetical protein
VQDKRSHSCPSGKSLLAALLIGLVLWLNAVAASPVLHELIHKDANQPGPECAVTLFAHGQVESAATVIPVVLTVTFAESSRPAEFLPSGSTIELLPPGRAPPAVVSSLG